MSAVGRSQLLQARFQRGKLRAVETAPSLPVTSSLNVFEGVVEPGNEPPARSVAVLDSGP